MHLDVQLPSDIQKNDNLSNSFSKMTIRPNHCPNHFPQSIGQWHFAHTHTHTPNHCPNHIPQNIGQWHFAHTHTHTPNHCPNHFPQNVGQWHFVPIIFRKTSEFEFRRIRTKSDEFGQWHLVRLRPKTDTSSVLVGRRTMTLRPSRIRPNSDEFGRSVIVLYRKNSAEFGRIRTKCHCPLSDNNTSFRKIRTITLRPNHFPQNIRIRIQKNSDEDEFGRIRTNSDEFGRSVIVLYRTKCHRPIRTNSDEVSLSFIGQ